MKPTSPRLVGVVSALSALLMSGPASKQAW